ncbi:MAG: ribosome biogenesis GTP-binding protein YihA/YsxC [Bacteroidia bacterium]|nr:YihA family ribosome biogenesis GTP-binding protein [Bacteroidia bacterium]MCZ2276535.1 ribosome biogenesis GTP-binding protein YihA/YsxC [Bacteroidia bacterium]
MKVISAEFVSAFTELNKLPSDRRPEFAFIGRSNVGKSSLINMLVQRKNLALTSSTPGKTQTINHFLVNHQWYMVDLPGYGFAKVSQKQRGVWKKMVYEYLLKREALWTVFVLIDSRVPPQRSDLDFISFLGENQIPLAIVFTKTDKLTKSKLESSIRAFLTKLEENWESLPAYFLTSSEKSAGRTAILDYISSLLDRFQN